VETAFGNKHVCVVFWAQAGVRYHFFAVLRCTFLCCAPSTQTVVESRPIGIEIVNLAFAFDKVNHSIGYTPGRTVALIVTPNGSNDVFPPKDGPFGGSGRWVTSYGENIPQKLPKKGA